MYPSSSDFLAVVGKSVSSITGVTSVVQGGVEAIVSVVASSSPAVVAEAKPVVSIESVEARISIIGGERSDPEAGDCAEVLRDSLGDTSQGGQGGQGSRHSLMKKYIKMMGWPNIFV